MNLNGIIAHSTKGVRIIDCIRKSIVGCFKYCLLMEMPNAIIIHLHSLVFLDITG